MIHGNIRRVCGNCLGDGQFPNADYDVVTGELVEPSETHDCSWCNGTGYLSTYEITLLTNIFESYVILENLDSTEYDALTDTQKDGVKLILMCGKVDLNVGKVGRVRLWNWFGSESTTVANLTALLS